MQRISISSVAKIRMIAVAALSGVCATATMGQTWNITTDWSDVANPNGAWSLRFGDGRLLSRTDFSAGWSTPQRMWGTIPGCWFKSNGTEMVTHDWIACDIVTHTSNSGDPALGMVIRWTSPFDGTVDVTGNTWWGGVPDQFFRANDWSVQLNGAVLTGQAGTIGSGSGRGRANPICFSEGSGGPLGLTGLRVHVGDELDLIISRNINSFGGNGSYTGVNFIIQRIHPGDFNRDGIVDSQDAFDFLAVFISNSPAADYNHSGLVDTQDLFEFLRDFFAA